MGEAESPLPPYYKPTDSMGSGSTYYPTSEELGKDEMRITFVGTCPFPPRLNQAATCIMVELGNGKRFFFDFGPSCLRNILAMQVPLQMVNDIFLTHLHVDHYGELPYLFCFAPWAAAGSRCGCMVRRAGHLRTERQPWSRG